MGRVTYIDLITKLLCCLLKLSSSHSFSIFHPFFTTNLNWYDIEYSWGNSLWLDKKNLINIHWSIDIFFVVLLSILITKKIKINFRLTFAGWVIKLIHIAVFFRYRSHLAVVCVLVICIKLFSLCLLLFMLVEIINSFDLMM